MAGRNEPYDTPYNYDDDHGEAGVSARPSPGLSPGMAPGGNKIAVLQKVRCPPFPCLNCLAGHA
jgi:hypothetical protein